MDESAAEGKGTINQAAAQQGFNVIRSSRGEYRRGENPGAGRGCMDNVLFLFR